MKDFFQSDEFREHLEEAEEIMEDGVLDDEDIMDWADNYKRLKKQYEDKQPDWYKIKTTLDLNSDYKEAHAIYIKAMIQDKHPHEIK